MKKIDEVLNKFVHKLYKMNYFVSLLIWFAILMAIMIPMSIVIGIPFRPTYLNIKVILIMDILFSLMINSMMRVTVASELYDADILELIKKAQEAETLDELLELKKESDNYESSDSGTTKLRAIINTRIQYEFKGITK